VAKESRMTEAQLMAAVIDLAHVYGWKCAHFRPAQTSKGWRTPVGADGKGFPDLVLAKPHALFFVELKAENGRLTAEQEAWGTVLGYSADWYVWYPHDWESERILRILSYVPKV
jgi:VRR-NUC domain